MFIDRYGIHIGFLYIRFYGILIMSGVILAAYLAARLAKKNGQDPERIWDMLPWALVLGIVGARLWHILTPPPSMVAQGVDTMYYLTHPLDALAVWNGGLGILGAVAGGALGAYIYLRKNGLSFMQWADFVAPGVLLAQAIGRWGNFINQELYGAPSNLPWAIYIDPAFRLPEFADVAYYHPTFLYESILNLLAVGLLLWMGKRFHDVLIHGDIFLAYLVVYPVIRFFMEFLRLDSSTVGGININQWMMLGIAVLAAVAIYVRHRTYRPEAVQDVEAREELPDPEVSSPESQESEQQV